MSKINIGDMFGSWYVVKPITYGKKYRCLCTSCGETYSNIRIHDLLKGKTRMCTRCSSSIRNPSHGLSQSSEYVSWVHMIQRCHNPNSKDYINYGDRGITVYPVWKDSFEAFYMYMGPKPDPSYTIERIDYNKSYEPGNVRWASKQEQTLNKRDNINLTIDGITKSVSEWAKESSLNAKTIYKRIERGYLDKYGPKHTVFSILKDIRRKNG